MAHLCLLSIFLLGVAISRCSASANIIYIGSCPLIVGGTCPDPAIRFFLFTRLNPSDGEQINGTDLPDQFNSSHPTKILMHGYNSGMSVLFDLRDAYLSHDNYNVIMLDWNELGLSPCYPTAVFNARFVGKCSAKIIQSIRETRTEDIHVLGFSLGAHVAGFTANHLRPYKLPRITGLDPAMPLFVMVSNDCKLDASDAVFVDVIHTNAFFQGKAEQLGQIDFYMNGGINQPGCLQESSPLGCDHHRALAYFAESISSSKGFWGWKCKSLIHYALGMCPPHGQPQLLGEFVNHRTEKLQPGLCSDHVEDLWRQLTVKLNSCGTGAMKDVKGWKPVFVVWRCNVRRKARDLLSEKRGTGESKTKPLTDLEERLLSLKAEL